MFLCFKLFICDELISVFDFVGWKEILDIMFKIKDLIIVIFLIYILLDVERICDYVVILNKGSIVFSGIFLEIKSMYGKDRFLLEFVSNDEI